MNITQVELPRFSSTRTMEAATDIISLSSPPWEKPVQLRRKACCAVPGCDTILSRNAQANVCPAHAHDIAHCTCTTCARWRDFRAYAALRGLTVTGEPPRRVTPCA